MPINTSPFNYFKLLAAVLLVSMLFACRNSKELIYLKNSADNEKFKALQKGETEYIIKPGDILYVSIKSLEPEVNALFNPEEGSVMTVSTQYQKFTTPAGAYLYGFEVDVKGNLQLPIIGAVPVSGNPISAVEGIVQGYADQYLKDAVVKVKLLNYKVTVLGEVKSPGVYYNYNNQFTVLDAIALANGNTDFANITRVMVVREEDGTSTSMMLNLSKKETFQSRGFYLHPNDYVFVEPDKHKNLQLNSQAISLVLSSVSVLLAVMGFVW